MNVKEIRKQIVNIYEKDIKMSNNFLHKKAKELNMDIDTICMFLVPFAMHYISFAPLKRNKLAYRDFMKEYI